MDDQSLNELLASFSPANRAQGEILFKAANVQLLESSSTYLKAKVFHSTWHEVQLIKLFSSWKASCSCSERTNCLHCAAAVLFFKSTPARNKFETQPYKVTPDTFSASKCSYGAMLLTFLANLQVLYKTLPRPISWKEVAALNVWVPPELKTTYVDLWFDKPSSAWEMWLFIALFLKRHSTILPPAINEITDCAPVRERFDFYTRFRNALRDHTSLFLTKTKATGKRLKTVRAQDSKGRSAPLAPQAATISAPPIHIKFFDVTESTPGKEQALVPALPQQKFEDFGPPAEGFPIERLRDSGKQESPTNSGEQAEIDSFIPPEYVAPKRPTLSYYNFYSGPYSQIQTPPKAEPPIIESPRRVASRKDGKEESKLYWETWLEDSHIEKLDERNLPIKLRRRLHESGFRPSDALGSSLETTMLVQLLHDPMGKMFLKRYHRFSELSGKSHLGLAMKRGSNLFAFIIKGPDTDEEALFYSAGNPSYLVSRSMILRLSSPLPPGVSRNATFGSKNSSCLALLKYLKGKVGNMPKISIMDKLEARFSLYVNGSEEPSITLRLFARGGKTQIEYKDGLWSCPQGKELAIPAPHLPDPLPHLQALDAVWNNGLHAYVMEEGARGAERLKKWTKSVMRKKGSRSISIRFDPKLEDYLKPTELVLGFVLEAKRRHLDSFELRLVALSNVCINEKEALELVACEGKAIRFHKRWHRIAIEEKENLRTLKRRGFKLACEGGKPITRRASQITASGLDHYLEKNLQKDLRRMVTRKSMKR